MQNLPAEGGRLNGNSPYLSYAPVQYSLTDGTSIPPPQTKMKESTLSPSSAAKSNGLSSLAGPLSSHPVTPVESPPGESGTNPFPDSYNWSRPSATQTTSNGDSTMQQQQQQQQRQQEQPINGSTVHAPHDSDDSNNFDPALPPHQPSRDTSRRPSFVDRFLPRLRSASFLRSRSSLSKFGDSSSSLARQQTPPAADGSADQPFNEQGRGVKRSASPALERPQSRGSTFPRMVRKKSMELLSTARRRSGMWGGENRMTASAMAEERELERQRELALEEEESRKRIEAIRKQLDRQPPPKLPELSGLGSVTGGGSLVDEDLFTNIGR